MSVIEEIDSNAASSRRPMYVVKPSPRHTYIHTHVPHRCARTQGHAPFFSLPMMSQMSFSLLCAATSSSVNCLGACNSGEINKGSTHHHYTRAPASAGPLCPLHQQQIQIEAAVGPGLRMQRRPKKIKQARSGTYVPWWSLVPRGRVEPACGRCVHVGIGIESVNVMTRKEGSSISHAAGGRLAPADGPKPGGSKRHIPSRRVTLSPSLSAPRAVRCMIEGSRSASSGAGRIGGCGTRADDHALLLPPSRRGLNRSSHPGRMDRSKEAPRSILDRSNGTPSYFNQSRSRSPRGRAQRAGDAAL